ncbi:MAG: prolyl oligopeptidase family serine peptidase [Jatrophihabitantaceae bacterium]
MTGFDDLAEFVALPRLTALTAGPDGARLVATMQQPDTDGARYTSSLWQLDPGGGAPVRLTRSDKGESDAAYLPDGSLLFISARPDPAGAEDDDAALWVLPPRGEPRVLARRPGGLGGAVVAASSGRIVLSGSRLRHSTDENDAERRTTRSTRKISAILHTGMPIRYWDHELGAESPRLLVADPDTGEIRDIAPDATLELIEAGYSVSADGASVATTWRTALSGGRRPASVAVIDAASAERRVVLTADGSVDYAAPVLSPDGARVAVARMDEARFDHPFHTDLVIATLDGETVVADLGDLCPTEWVWSPESSTLYISGDLHGRGAVLAVDPMTGFVERRLVSDACYTSLRPSPDGAVIFALRSSIDTPPTPVVITTDGADQSPAALRSPAAVRPLPGHLVELSATTPDGQSVHGWLCLPPAGDHPAPVMLWIHGGPMSSWNAWSWRWNPWVAVAHGWAVVLPDPALSTGYGQAWLDRAWPYVAAEVFADCTAVLDAVLELPDVDASRVACLGASFGGYMTNWVAGHAAEHFGAIVTHAGLYALDQQHKTTDLPQFKTGIFGEPAEHPDWYAANSPHNGEVGGTPMLVIHGNNDYRVPVSEAIRLWWDLVSGWDGDPEDLPHRFLQLTGENHWVLSPANHQIWYDAVLGFCADHVLGQKWTPSELL